ncbi:Autophagy protein 5 [Neolecta irregularis DAH-3]|uniref:Autophagy protein 5 n=1 Tax=Neolecta irregularis (strain DAH-3) TaxID=1198029 RepID=A0A1U7LQU8_NEOID|nr:Autophagy protein 5 [Neolecta irregularis DAH-3]|eukprot:OLL24891.1 Autophagy protein 5 [Neolecta irregularis DAH-3]
MSIDNLRLIVWDGIIPVRIILDPEESRVYDQANAYYLAVPRVSYLSLYNKSIINFFWEYLLEPEAATDINLWFEFENAPLKWHWPIGLLYDLHSGFNPERPGSEPKIPFTLILHFKDYPTAHLPLRHTSFAIYDAFMNLVKEADFMRNGNAKGVLSLSKEMSNQLWEGLSKPMTDEYDQYYSVASRIFTYDAETRVLPVRIYLPSGAPVVQKIINSGKEETIGTMLHVTLPALFPSRKSLFFAKPMIHGIILDLDMPLLEVGSQLAYPDGWMHIVILMKEKNKG